MDASAIRNLVIFGIVAMTQAALARLHAEERTDFSGIWILNEEKSDSMPMGRRGGREGRGGPGNQFTRMVVSQEGAVLTIQRVGGAEGGDAELSLEPGQGPKEVSTPMGTAQVEAEWDGKELVVYRIQERQTPRGNMTIEQEQRWKLSGEGNTLIQELTIKTPRRDIDLTLVFDKQ